MRRWLCTLNTDRVVKWAACLSGTAMPFLPDRAILTPPLPHVTPTPTPAGATAGRRGEDGGRPTNDTLLSGALAKQEDTTVKLRDALTQVEQTRETGRYTAAKLEEGREKIRRIDAGLDEVESELEISRKLITRFVKRIYTDRVIIAFTTLIVLALAGIIIYATLNPGQVRRVGPGGGGGLV